MTLIEEWNEMKSHRIVSNQIESNKRKSKPTIIILNMLITIECYSNGCFGKSAILMLQQWLFW